MQSITQHPFADQYSPSPLLLAPERKNLSTVTLLTGSAARSPTSLPSGQAGSYRIFFHDIFT